MGIWSIGEGESGSARTRHSPSLCLVQAFLLAPAHSGRSVLAGPYRLDVTSVGDERQWVAVTDTTHPALAGPPLPPSENRLPVAVEAGLQKLPSVDGY